MSIFLLLIICSESYSQKSNFADLIKEPLHYTPNLYPETYDQKGYKKLMDTLIRWEMTRSMYDYSFSGSTDQIKSLAILTESDYGLAMFHYLEGIRKGLGDPLNAENDFLKALDYFKANQDTSAILHTTMHLLRLSLNTTLFEIGNIKRYKNLYEDVLVMGERAKEPFDQIIYYRMKLIYDEYFYNLKKVSYFKADIEKGLSLVDEMPEKYNYYKFLMLSTLGSIHSKNIESIESEKYHVQAYEFIKNYPSLELNMALYRLGVMQYANNKFDEATITLNKIERIIPNKRIPINYEVTANYNRMMTLIYFRKGDIIKAEEYYNYTHSIYVDDFFRKRHLLYMQDMAALYKNELNTKIILENQRRQTNLILITFIVFAISIITIIYSRFKTNANKKLQKEIRKRDFIYSMIGHDLSSPILAMDNTLNHIEITLNDQLTAVQKNYISLLKSEIKGAHFLLLNLLHWYKSDIDLSGHKLDKHQSHVKKNIDQSVQHLFLQSHEIPISFINKCPDDILFDLNVEMFNTVIRNIIDNAAKHSACTIIIVDAKIENKKLMLTINDNGLGMNPKFVKTFNNSNSIFDLNNSELKIGLGTIFILEFAKSMNSVIKVSSDNEGTTYYWEINS